MSGALVNNCLHCGTLSSLKKLHSSTSRTSCADDFIYCSEKKKMQKEIEKTRNTGRFICSSCQLHIHREANSGEENCEEVSARLVLAVKLTAALYITGKGEEEDADTHR